MSHLSSPPQKHKGEHKSLCLPRGSERWAGQGVGLSGWGRGYLSEPGGGETPLHLLLALLPMPMPGDAPPGTRTAVQRSQARCPCLLEGRPVGPTAPSLRRRRGPPIVSSMRSRPTFCNMPTILWTGECPPWLPEVPSTPFTSPLLSSLPSALGTPGDRKPSTRPGEKTNRYSSRVSQTEGQGALDGERPTGCGASWLYPPTIHWLPLALSSGLLHLPLVSPDGGGVVPERRDQPTAQRRLRQCEGGPGGAARCGQGVHDLRAGGSPVLPRGRHGALPEAVLLTWPSCSRPPAVVGAGP